MLKQERFRPIDILVLIIGLFFLFLLLFGCSKNSNNSVSSMPEAHFSYTSLTAYPFAVKFINESTAAAAGATYDWDMDDGIFYTNRPDSFTHIYPTFGNYNVKLIKIEANGNRDTTSMPLDLTDTIGPSGQSARIASTAFSYHLIYTTTFNNTSVNASTYYWDFGDGTSSTSATPVFSKDYDAPGTYHVKLKAIEGTAVDSTELTINF